MFRRVLRTVALFVVCLVAVTLAAGFSVKWYADHHFYDGYDPRQPLNASASEFTRVDGTINSFGVESPAKYRRQRIELDVRPGERIPALMTLPLEANGPVPVIVFLHGSHQEKEDLEHLCTPFNEAGFAMVCFDQYMRGERKVPKGNLLHVLSAYRERCWKNVLDTRHLVDYLQTRPDLDHKRIYLMGVSFGAITGTAVLAHEPRLLAGDLVVGGGDLRLLSTAPQVRRELAHWMLPFAAPLVKFVVGPIEPLRQAAAIAGRPVLLQNGSNDDVIVPEAGKALYAALRDPKEIRWYPVNHPNLEKNGAETVKMLGEGLKWLQEQDAKAH